MGVTISFGGGRRPPRRHRSRRHYSSSNTVYTKASPKQAGIIGLILLLIGAGCLIFYFNFRSDIRAKDFASTTGVVYDYKYNSDCRYYDEECTAAIKVEYYVDGKRYTVTSNSYSSIPKNIGSHVDVRYDSYNPSNAIISSKDNGDVIILVVGAIFGLVGVIVLFSVVKDVISGKDSVE